jgi:antitoxin (DNA-binding transcriptional repressor) of toxin-antitoxin stability system
MHVGRLPADRHVVARGHVRRPLRRDHRVARLAAAVKTVTITEAKKHLGAHLKDAVAGQNIGIICGNRIVALRPVEVTSLDLEEAGDPEATSKLTAEQKDRLYAQLKKERKEAKRRRKELLSGSAPA